MPPRSPRQAPKAMNEVFGLLLLALFAVLLLTGTVIWGLRVGDRMSGVMLVFVHAWAGLASLPILIGKLVVGTRAWLRKSAQDTLSPRFHMLTAALVAAVAVLYGSGLLMYANLTPGGAAVYKQVHLWAAITGAGLTTWHLVHYLGRAARLVTGVAGRAEEPEVLASRRLVLRAGGLGLLAWLGLRGSGQLLADAGRDDPNNFPVTITSGGEDRPDPDRWRMVIDGDVANPRTLGLADLRARPIERHTYPLDCVIGWTATREWGGVPLAALLDEAEPLGDVLAVRVVSTTGYAVSLRPEVAWRGGALVAWEVEGVPLTPEHGYPGRLMVPDVIGEQCVKWLQNITVVAKAERAADAA